MSAECCDVYDATIEVLGAKTPVQCLKKLNIKLSKEEIKDHKDNFQDHVEFMVCNEIMNLMCSNCPLEEECHPTIDDVGRTNHEQMCICVENLGDRKAGIYPSEIEIPYEE
jgi:hypothetical protein